MRIVWTSTALGGLADVPSVVGAAILRKVKLAGKFPDMFPERQRGRYRGYRWFPVGDWLVIYQVIGRRLAIMGVVHGARADS